MIQRIQTIWLLLAAIAGFFLTKLPLYEGSTGSGLPVTYTATESLLLFALTIVAALLAFVSIFLFKNRKQQMRFSLFGILLSIILTGLVVYMFDSFKTANPGFTKSSYSWGALLPLAMIIFFIMAWNNMRKDEKLIKSLDRLR